MWRHRATCRHCGLGSNWNQDREVSAQEICAYLKEHHNLGEPLEAVDYHLEGQRQCDSCLEPYVDDCTKCRRDFCGFHAGDIDGLCGDCI